MWGFGRRGHGLALGFALAGILLATPPYTRALDPALDVSQYAHTSWKIRDGFAKGIISSIAQTPDGYLWLGTIFGLLRFDGVRAVPWQPPAGQQLPGDFVYSLLVSHDGTLWIGTRGGLASWSGGTLTQYPELAGATIYSLLEDREGTVWAAGEVLGSSAPQPRLCGFRRGRVQCYGEGGPLQQGPDSLYEDSKGNLWVGGRDGLWRWKPGAPQHYDTSPVGRIMEDENGALILAGRGGLRRFLGGRTERYVLPGVGAELPIRLFRSSDGSLWGGTEAHGLVHVHGGRTDWFERGDGLTSNAVFAIFEDREGNVWIGTDEGLDRFRDFAVPTILSNQGLPDGTHSLLAANDGSVWAASSSGLSRWKDGKATIYSWRRPNNLSSLAGAPRAAMTTAQVVSNSGLPAMPESLFEDHLGQIWATTAKGIVRRNGSRFVPVNGVPGAEVYAMAEDREGGVWVSSSQQGLFRVPRSGGVEKTPWSRGRGEYAIAVAVDPSQGGLWLGFSHGDIAYWKDGQLRASYSAKDGLGTGAVRQLRFGTRGTLWAATQGGLSRIKGGHIETLTSKNGLPCDVVHWSVEDDEHFVWLYMPCGLARVARSELDAWASNPEYVVRTAVYDISDGVRLAPTVGGFSPHVAKSPDGKIWFVPSGGLSVIDPRHIPFNRLPPPVHIEQITADRKIYSVASAASGQIRLPPLTRDLKIDYTALSLVAPEKVLFRHKLEGWDRDWQDVSTRRQAFYMNLRPGKYTFHVTACNNSGVWNEAGTTLDFSIAPAYYQTRWFQALCLLAAILIGWALYHLRVRHVANSMSARFDERLAERTRVARELHDTLLQTIQGSKFIADGVLLDPSNDPTRLRGTLERLSGSLHLAVEEARGALNSLRASTTQKNDLAASFREVMEECKRDTCMETSMRLSGTTKDMHPVAREEVYRIGYEAIRNACMHSQAKQLDVALTYARDLTLSVRDNGIGMDPVVVSKGKDGHFGLHGMRERAARIGAKLTLVSSQNAGTEMTLLVPGRSIFRKPGTSPLEKLKAALKGQDRPSRP